jgi:para-nitrobenzyl esterase
MGAVRLELPILHRGAVFHGANACNALKELLLLFHEAEVRGGDESGTIARIRFDPEERDGAMKASALRKHCLARLAAWLIGVGLSICLSLQVSALATAADNLTIAIASGQIRGATRPSGGAEFLGIPYAQPPVGELRWREPQPAQGWRGTRDATKFGAPCAQRDLGGWNRRDAESGKEDCLFLNVMIPKWPAKEKLPVMVWLHGGANEGGSASSELYKNGTLVQHGVILVTVNYRLGIFGFMAQRGLEKESPHHVSGNYALLDQILALHWVHNNVSKFGGDPENVTLFGQSAGAHDSSLLMSSPLARGLFQRVIQESGSPLSPPLRPLAEAEAANDRILATLNVPADGAIAFLRRQTKEVLLNAVGGQDPEGIPVLGPIVDGYVLPRSPVESFAAGEEAPVPVIVGTTTREFGMQGSPDEIRNMIREVAGSVAERTFEVYGLANGGSGNIDPVFGPAGDQWFADLVFRCPLATEAIWHHEAHHLVYEYQFGRAIPGQEAQGAVHSADLPYVFGFYPQSGNIAGAFSETDFKLADLIETYFTNFAKTGNPNGNGAPEWPEFDRSQRYIFFQQDGQATVENGGLRRKQCELYREALRERMKNGR